MRLILDWSMVAAQADAKGQSILSLGFPTPVPRSQVVSKWRMEWLMGTLGDGRGTGGGTNKNIISHPKPLDTVTSFSLLASQVGRAISKSLRLTTKGLQEQQVSKAAVIRREKDAGYIYSEEELYLMMGWAHVRRFSDLPNVWLEFMKTKKVDTLRDK